MNNYKAAAEVIAGKWGSGVERQRRLASAGYDYSAVQQIVNGIMSAKDSFSVTFGNSNANDSKRLKTVNISLKDYDGINLMIEA